MCVFFLSLYVKKEINRVLKEFLGVYYRIVQVQSVYDTENTVSNHCIQSDIV